MNFFDLSLAGLESWCLDHDLPKFTAKQLRNWIWKHGVLDPEEMTNVSAKARVAMQEHLTLHESAVVTEQLASDGTQKLLTAWPKPDQGKALSILDPSYRVTPHRLRLQSDWLSSGLQVLCDWLGWS